jgi:hypothetical protein
VAELPEPVHDPEEVRSLAEQILGHPRYREPAEPLLDRFLGWVGDRLADLLSLAGGGEGAVGGILSWLLIAAALLAIGYVVYRYGRNFRIERTSEPGAAPAMVELTRSPAAWREEAAALASEGRYREAVRCRHRALVADLVAADVIPEIPGRTAREYVADVAVNRPPAGPSAAEATDLFEAAWYGDAPTGAPELARFEDLEARVLDRRTAGAGTP